MAKTAKTELIYEKHPQDVILALALELKKIPEFKMPEWAEFVKTGAGKQRLPAEEGWWQVRAASLLRKLYIKKVIGVERLRGIYSNKKSRGVKPERVYKSGGKIIRVILQQAETAGLVEKLGEKSVKKGRRLTNKGKEFLDKIISKD